MKTLGKFPGCFLFGPVSTDSFQEPLVYVVKSVSKLYRRGDIHKILLAPHGTIYLT